MTRALVAALFLLGCGRSHFEIVDDAVDGPRGDVATDGAQLPPSYVKPFAERHPGAGATDTFTVQADATGNLIALQVACSSAVTPGSVAVTGGTWNFVAQTGIFGFGSLWAETLVAFAPDTLPATLTVTWNVGCTGGKSELGDEFASAATSGADITGGNGNGMGTVTTMFANEAVWAACFSSFTVTAVGPGYTKGADNGGGDWTEYKLTMDPPGTVEVASFTSTTSFMVSTLSLQPR